MRYTKTVGEEKVLRAGQLLDSCTEVEGGEQVDSEVNASQEKWLGYECAEVFALNFTQAAFYGFRIQDFRLEPSKRKVTFHGELGSKEGEYTDNHGFRAEFQFDGFSLAVTTSCLSPEEETYVIINQSN